MCKCSNVQFTNSGCFPPTTYNNFSFRLLKEDKLLNVLNKRNLQQYTVEAVKIEEGVVEDHDKGIRVDIVLARRVEGILVNTYLPTILMNIINQATMYLDCDHYFEAIIATNMTCITVLAALYILFSSVVPQTSYIKLVDIWFLFNLLHPFFLIVLQIFIKSSKRKEKEETEVVMIKDGEINPKGRGKIFNSTIGLMVGRIVMPIIAGFFAMIYFGIVIFFL